MSKKLIIQKIKTPFNVFLTKKIQETIKKNEIEVIESANVRDKNLIARIENFRREKMTTEEMENNTTDSIIESIKTNTIIRAVFRKDTTRQSLYEKAQIEWIQNHQYDDAVKMSTNGTCLSKNKFHIISKTNRRPKDATKTFDVYIPSKNIFAVLKYTTVPGGSQDNQFADVKHFVIQAIGYLSENLKAPEKFSMYLDGAYYTSKKVKELYEIIPDNFKEKILITNCSSI